MNRYSKPHHSTITTPAQRRNAWQADSSKTREIPRMFSFVDEVVCSPFDDALILALIASRKK